MSQISVVSVFDVVKAIVSIGAFVSAIGVSEILLDEFLPFRIKHVTTICDKLVYAFVISIILSIIIILLWSIYTILVFSCDSIVYFQNIIKAVE